mmetsp:Transcript_46428/g.108083  ORF Transcript_46428/g.108083 Transcript_46428/m.108083 type:complete len:214 (+) Transcript_46428:85-726(+)
MSFLGTFLKVNLVRRLRMPGWKVLLLTFGLFTVILVVSQVLEWIWVEADAMQVALSWTETVVLCINWLLVGLMRWYVSYAERRRVPGKEDCLMVVGTLVLVFLAVSNAAYTAALTFIALHKPMPSPILLASRHLCGHPLNILRGHPGILAVGSQALFAWLTFRMARRMARIKDGDVHWRVGELDTVPDETVTPEVLGVPYGVSSAVPRAMSGS